MKKLYSIMYPNMDVARVDTLYVRGDECLINASADNKYIHILKGKKINFCTYYNSFSLEKWKKYTELSSLYLKLKVKGEIRIDIYIKYLTAGDYLDKFLYRTILKNNELSETLIDLSEYINYAGLLYFEITAFDDYSYFYSGEYLTAENFDLPNIGLIICTYKRESYIRTFVNNFNANKHLKNLYTFIVDNGQTLPDGMENEKIHIFKNRNYGGAGGFTRGMLEIKDWNERHSPGIDYMLLMDDDIVIDFNIFERLTSFIALRKAEYRNHFIAGGMCSLDYPYLQYERIASWRGNGFVQMGASYDLRDINTIITNEREDKMNNCSAGWWFSCFPSNMVTANNYPFPCFFRGDDMEFTIRNGSNIITLNGLNVWHEPFYKKYSITSENYYLYRNALVINTLYLPEVKLHQTVQYLFKRFVAMLITYDYRGAELLLRAWKDYCQGVDFFSTTDPEVLNKELMQLNYKMEPIENTLVEYRFDDISSEIYGKTDKNIMQSIIRHLTLNGFLIPKCFYKSFGFSLVGFGARYINFYRTKDVYCFEPFSRKGYFLHVSKKDAIRLMITFGKQYCYFKKNRKKIYANYQTNFYKLQTEEFWRDYLDI